MQQILAGLISVLLSVVLLNAYPIPVRAQDFVPDLIATEGQDFTFTIPRDTFTDLEGESLTYTVSGLPKGFKANGLTMEWHPDEVENGQVENGQVESWRCDTPFDLSIAGYYPLKITATNLQGKTIEMALNLQVLMAPFIVDLDATWNYFSTFGCRRNLPPGTYKIEVITRNEGGRFDAWNRKTLWEQGYYIKPLIGRVERVGRYATLEELAKHPMPDQFLSLPMPDNVVFYLVDTVDITNNKGGYPSE
jgi:hypothetical protein